MSTAYAIAYACARRRASVVSMNPLCKKVASPRLTSTGSSYSSHLIRAATAQSFINHIHRYQLSRAFTNCNTLMATVKPCAIHTRASPAASSQVESTSSSVSSTENPFVAAGLRSTFLLRRLRQIGVQAPTEIQIMVREMFSQTHAVIESIPEILQSSSVLIGSETGSGKTLAYVLPVLDQLIATLPAESGSGVPNSSESRDSTRDRRYPSVIVFQPNRELIHQLESVLHSLIGPSGSRIPITDAANGPFVRVHYASMHGTQLFPIPSQPQIDILITTPACLQHNIPFHDFFRARSKRHKEILEFESSSAMPPASSSNSALKYNSRFDMVEFVRSNRTIIMDEVDFLLEGAFQPVTKSWIEDVWMRKRLRRKLHRFPPKQAGKIVNAELMQQKEEEEIQREQEKQNNSPTATYGAALYELQQSDRQFIFVGATLTNISPRTTFQYLINAFSRIEDLPPISQTGPINTKRESLPQSCSLVPILSSSFHHVSPHLNQSIEWVRVGAQKSSNGSLEIDEARLAAFDAKHQAPVTPNPNDPNAEFIVNDQEELAAAAERDGIAKGKKNLRKGQGDRFFKSKQRMAEEMKNNSWAWNVESNESEDHSLQKNGKKHSAPHSFQDEVDIEKLNHTIDFLNSITPSPTSQSTNSAAAPMKSLLFVDSTSRVQTLLSSFAAAQRPSSWKTNGLSNHVQFIPYHAELKPRERLAAMELFNSSEPAAPHNLFGDSMPVTHQVLVCTSLVSRGLDFNRITPPPVTVASSSASDRNDADSGVASSQDSRAGFSSLIQFDFAKNVIDYIHRVGRMFRMRASTPEPSTTAADAVRESHHPRVLNLFTGVDELLVSHIRGQVKSQAMDLEMPDKAGEIPDNSESQSATSESHQEARNPMFIPNDAFSRKRRLRHNAKRQQQRFMDQQRLQSEQSGDVDISPSS